MKRKNILCGMTAVLLSAVMLSACTANTPVVQESSIQQSSKEESSQNSVRTSNEEESSQIQESEVSDITPALWKVKSSDGKTMYCFGSIHVADEDITFPEYFEKAYQECDGMAFEYDVTSSMELEGALNSMAQMMYQDGTTIKDHIPESDYKKAVGILKEYNMYVNYYDYFQVFFWTSLMENICIQEAGLNALKGIDMQLINRTKNDGKKLLEVESEEEQMNVFLNMSDELQSLLFREYLEEGAIQEQADLMKQTYTLWKQGKDVSDLDVDTDEEESMTDSETELYNEYEEALLIKRNIKMADAAEGYIKSGDTVMMVVGAAHYYGEGSVLDLLEDRGYVIERVQPAA